MQTDTATQELELVTSSLRHLEARRVRIVGDLRERGVTWVVIGRALGVTHQAAQQRYGAK